MWHSASEGAAAAGVCPCLMGGVCVFVVCLMCGVCVCDVCAVVCRQYEYILPVEMLRPLGTLRDDPFDEEEVLRRFFEVLRQFQVTTHARILDHAATHRSLPAPQPLGKGWVISPACLWMRCRARTTTTT